MPRSNHQSTPMDADYFAEEVAFCFDVIESVVVGIMCGDHAGFDPAELASLPTTRSSSSPAATPRSRRGRSPMSGPARTELEQAALAGLAEKAESVAAGGRRRRTRARSSGRSFGSRPSSGQRRTRRSRWSCRS